MSCFGQFVIVEGIDGSGKTTLAERIASEFGAEYQHVGPPREDMSAFAEHVEYALGTNVVARSVFDRFHFGCFAYGPIWRPANDHDGIGDFRRAEWDFFEMLIRPHCLVVLCDPSWTTIETWWRNRGSDRQFAEYEESLDLLHQVYDRFHKAREVTTLYTVDYDYNHGDAAWEAVVEAIEEKLTWTPG